MGEGHRGNAETLRRYWAEGEGAAKIRWGSPGDFDRCVSEVGKYMPGRAKGYCNLLHHRALGYYPATHAKMMGASHGLAADAVALGIADGAHPLVQRLVDGGRLVSRNLPDGTLELAHLDRHGFVLALTRHVRTPAGVRRYGLPIGSAIGGKPGDAVRELRLHHEGKTATIRRTASGAIERRNADRKTWRPATASEAKIFGHAEKRHDAEHAAIRAGGKPQRGADFVKAGEKARAARPAKAKTSGGTPQEHADHFVNADKAQRTAMVRNLSNAQLDKLDAELDARRNRSPEAANARGWLQEMRRETGKRTPVTPDKFDRTKAEKGDRIVANVYGTPQVGTVVKEPRGHYYGGTFRPDYDVKLETGPHAGKTVPVSYLDVHGPAAAGQSPTEAKAAAKALTDARRQASVARITAGKDAPAAKPSEPHPAPHTLKPGEAVRRPAAGKETKRAYVDYLSERFDAKRRAAQEAADKADPLSALKRQRATLTSAEAMPGLSDAHRKILADERRKVEAKIAALPNSETKKKERRA